jgi:hypothetical protein
VADPITGLWKWVTPNRKRGKGSSHPVRDAQRKLTKFKRDRAKWKAERLKLRLERDKAAKLRAATKAAERRRKDALARERMERAAARERARKEAPRVVQVRTPQPATPAPVMGAAARPPRSAAAAAGLCGAKTEDGTPCQRPVTDGPCGAPGHERHHARTTRRAIRAGAATT